MAQAQKGVAHITERVATPHIAALQTWERGLLSKIMEASGELDRGEEKTASAVARDKAILCKAIEQVPDGPARATLQAMLRWADTVVPPRAFALAALSDPRQPLLLYKCAGLGTNGYEDVQDAFCKGIRALGFGPLAYKYAIRGVDLAPQSVGASRAGGRGPADGQRGVAVAQPYVWNPRAPAATAKPPDRFKTARACCIAATTASLPALTRAGLKNALCHYDNAATCRVEAGQTYCNATVAQIDAGTLTVVEDVDTESRPLGTFSLRDAKGRLAGDDGGQPCCARLRLWLAQPQQQPGGQPGPPAQGEEQDAEPPPPWEYPRHVPLVMFSSVKSGIPVATYEAVSAALLTAPALAGVRADMETAVADVRASLGIRDVRYGTRCKSLVSSKDQLASWRCPAATATCGAQQSRQQRQRWPLLLPLPVVWRLRLQPVKVSVVEGVVVS